MRITELCVLQLQISWQLPSEVIGPALAQSVPRVAAQPRPLETPGPLTGTRRKDATAQSVAAAQAQSRGFQGAGTFTSRAFWIIDLRSSVEPGEY